MDRWNRAQAAMKIPPGVVESYVCVEWWIQWPAEMKCFLDTPLAAKTEVMVDVDPIGNEADVHNAGSRPRVKEFASIRS